MRLKSRLLSLEKRIAPPQPKAWLSTQEWLEVFRGAEVPSPALLAFEQAGKLGPAFVRLGKQVLPWVQTQVPDLLPPLQLELSRLDPLYFLATFAQIYDATAGTWIPFRPWPIQNALVQQIQDHRLVVALKARQLGLTWTVLGGWVLHQMLFFPAATELFFSRREEEAAYLLGQERLRGMWQRLPTWLRDQTRAWPRVDSMTTWVLENGSVARAFPSNAGDSYTATTAFCDEFDLIDEKGQSRLLRSVKPTIDNGGRLILLSRPDKTKPSSPFKRIYQAAKSGASSWEPFFAAWDTHPGRDRAWYEAQKADVMARTGSLDDLHEQYPANDAEALAPRSLDKRFAPAWLAACYREQQPILRHGGPAIPALFVFAPPEPARLYVVGADPAEGNPTSDESAACVLDVQTGEQVAVLAGRIEPSVFAAYLGQIAAWYNRAGVLVERQNHGHAVLLALPAGTRKLPGHDGKEGWMSSTLGKTILYDAGADALRNKEVLVHDFMTWSQLSSVEGNKLRAPEGQFEDRADAFCLAVVARVKGRGIQEYRGSRTPARGLKETWPKGV